MSLYQLSKFLYSINRDEGMKERFRDAAEAELEGYSLTAEERLAVLKPDIGLLYVLGVNGQILMHYAAYRGIAWADYLQQMRDGVRVHGPVRAGVYAMTTALGDKVAGV